MAPAPAQTAFADSYVSTGNGAAVYYNDGSRVEYNARGSEISLYDSSGSLVEQTFADFTESEFKSLFYSYGNNDSDIYSGNGSRSSRSSSSSKYAGAELYDAYWNTGHRARWEADYQSSAKYTVTLYCDGHKVTTKSSKGGKSVDFSSAIASHNKTGEYYFTVKASWTGGYTDSATSETDYIDSAELARLRQNNGSSGSSSGGVISTGGPGSGPGGGPGGYVTSSQGPGVNTTTGWQNSGGVWRYLRPNGSYAVNCWEYINDKWYYFDTNGVMASGRWVQTDAWYYVGQDGDMQVNTWVRDAARPNVWYYVGGDGKMVTSQSIDGWWCNENGECFS